MATARLVNRVDDDARGVEAFWRPIGVIAAIAVGVRLAALAFLPRLGFGDGLGGDGDRYHLAASALAAGRGYINPYEGWADALHPPMWTTVLAVADLVGLGTPVQQAVLTSFMGAGTVVLLGLAGRRLASPRAGLVAAAMGALYPGLWVYERNLNAETLVFPLVVGIILVAYRYRDHPTRWGVIGLACLIAVLALTRSEQLLLVPLLLIPLVVATRDLSWSEKLVRLALGAVVIIVLISPWTIYNLGRLERPVVLSAGAGNSMVVSSCDEAFGGELMGSYSVDCYFRAADEVDEVDRSLQDLAFREIAMEYTMDNLDRLPVVVVAREGRSWSFFRPSHSALMHAEQMGIDPEVIVVQIFVFWALLIAAAAGALQLRRRHVPIYPLMAFPVIVTISAALTFGDIRYRAPAEIPVLLLAAVFVDARWRSPSGREAAVSRSRSDI